MGLIVTTITLKTNNPIEMRDFYSALGFEFQQVKVDKGSAIWRAHAGTLVFNLLGSELSHANTYPSYQLSFECTEIQKKIQKIKELAIGEVMMEDTELGDRIMAVVIDPDGHAVELSQSLTA